MIIRSSSLKKHKIAPQAVFFQISTQRQVGIYCRQTPHILMDFDRQPEFMPLDITEDLIDQLHTMGTKRITISGLGDPALHPGLKRILQKCQTLDFNTVLETTTLNLTPLLLTQANVVRVPLWAFSLRHQNETCPDLDEILFSSLVETLDQLALRRKQKENFAPDIEIVVTLTAENMVYLLDIENLLTNGRVQRVYFRYVNKATALNELETSPDPTLSEVQEMFSKLEKILQANKVASNLKTFRKEGTTKKFIWNAHPCWAGFSFARISPYGEVRPCQHSRLIAGNIFETHSFEAIWNSQRFGQFCTQMSTQFSLLGSYEECGACPYLSFNRKVSRTGLICLSEFERTA